MPDEQLKLPGCSYERLTQIIQGYGHSQGETSLEEVARAAGIDKFEISRNNTFLSAVGLIEGGKKKALTDKGRALALALEHSMAGEVQRAWLKVVEESEFFRRVVAAVRIRKGMEESTLLAHIAYTAGMPKTQKTAVGAAAVLEILKASGHLTERDGQYVVQLSLANEGAESEASQAPPPPPGPLPPAFPGAVSLPLRPGVNVVLHLQVACQPGDLDTIGPKLAKLVDDLRKLAESE